MVILTSKMFRWWPNTNAFNDTEEDRAKNDLLKQCEIYF